ncbi:MAG: YraN family protein [Pseudomonadota bacterium]|nr:YraN family protein [Pseudomonadota bacterium]
MAQIVPPLRGAAAEELAAAYLQGRGLSIIARNMRCKLGELDLVCLHAEVLVVVEVRQRAQADFGGALASVNSRKRRKLVRATQFQWQRRPAWRARVLRFDVLAVQGRPDGTYDIEWVKDAFRG